MKAILITSSILILALAALRPVLRGRFKSFRGTGGYALCKPISSSFYL